MAEKLNLLLELQELDLVLKEAKIVHGEEPDTERLQERIAEIRSGLDVPTLSRYDRLISHGVSVVHEQSGMCMGCNLSIPVGDRNRIRSGKLEPICPHCGKFLIVSDQPE